MHGVAISSSFFNSGDSERLMEFDSKQRGSFRMTTLSIAGLERRVGRARDSQNVSGLLVSRKAQVKMARI